MADNRQIRRSFKNCNFDGTSTTHSGRAWVCVLHLVCPAIPTVKLYSLSSEFEEVEATLIQQQRRSEILPDGPIVVKKSKPISAMEGITNDVGGDDAD